MYIDEYINWKMILDNEYKVTKAQTLIPNNQVQKR